MNPTPSAAPGRLILDRLTPDVGLQDPERFIFEFADEAYTIRFGDYDLDHPVVEGTTLYVSAQPEVVIEESVFVHRNARRYLTIPAQLADGGAISDPVIRKYREALTEMDREPEAHTDAN